jgi:hypothetical protein
MKLLLLAVLTSSLPWDSSSSSRAGGRGAPPSSSSSSSSWPSLAWANRGAAPPRRRVVASQSGPLPPGGRGRPDVVRRRDADGDGGEGGGSRRRPSSVGATGGIDDGGRDDLRRRTLDAALRKMRSIDDPAFGPNFNMRRMRSVEVRESSLPGAGLGLFATSGIRSGTIVTFYPVHAIGIVDAVGGGALRRVSADVGTGRTREGGAAIPGDVGSDDGGGSDDDFDGSYLLHVFGSRPLMDADVSRDLGGSSIFVDVDPARVGPPRTGEDGAAAIASCGFDGHRVNDGATVLSNDEGGALAYYRASRAAKNCVHVPFGPSPLLALVSTRKIRRGDELLTTYGCSCE